MIGLSPLPTGHPLRFQPKWVRPPRGLTPASACPWVAHPASRPRRATHVAVLKTRFRCGSLQSLTSPRIVTRWLILQKARRHTVKGAPTARGRAVSGAVSLPSRGAFHLSLTVLVRYRSRESVQPWRVVPPASRGVSRARATLGRRPAASDLPGTGLSPCSAGFPGRSPRWLVCNSGRGMRPSVAPPNNTGAETPARLHARRFGLARFRSPLLPGSRLISLPRGT